MFVCVLQQFYIFRLCCNDFYILFTFLFLFLSLPGPLSRFKGYEVMLKGCIQMALYSPVRFERVTVILILPSAGGDGTQQLPFSLVHTIENTDLKKKIPYHTLSSLPGTMLGTGSFHSPNIPSHNSKRHGAKML